MARTSADRFCLGGRFVSDTEITQADRTLTASQGGEEG